MSLTAALAAFTHDCRYETVPHATRRAAVRCLLDHLGCVVGGMRTELGQLVAGLVVEMGGQPQATLVAGGRQVPTPAAALANGTAANALDFDDTLEGHPGATVCAGALATAELVDARAGELLAAIVAGYEVCARVAHYWQPDGGRYIRVWDTATLQTFGTACAAASLLKLNPEQIQHALGIALTTAPSPRARATHVKAQIRPLLKSAWGWAAEAGVRAALLAQAGLTAAPFALDNLTLVWRPDWLTYSGLEGPTDRLGEQFFIEQVEFKPYPACRFLHSPLDAVSEIMAGDRVAWQDVVQIQVEGFSLLGDPFHNIPAPTSRSEAQFSTPFSIATLLYHGRLTPEAFAPEALRNRNVLDLAQRVAIATDPVYERAFPQKSGARVSIVSRASDSGYERLLQSAVDNPRGTPDNPLDDDTLRSKFAGLVEPLLGTQAANDAANTILNIEKDDRVRDLMRIVA